MAHIVIEMDRGNGWEVRSAGEAAGVTVRDLVDYLPSFALQYPHRAFLDGILIAEAQRPHGRRGKTRIVQFIAGNENDA